MEKLKVVMLGPALHQHGGMATVENLILRQPFTDVQIRHLATHDEGSVLHRLRIFSWALLQFLGLLLAGQVDNVHLHVSERGSVFRKAILTLIARCFRKPVIMHTHGCEFRQFYENLPIVGQRLVTWIFHQCVYVITLSESWKRYYGNTCGLSTDRVLVLHNPVDVPVQVPNRRHDPIVRFAFLGRIGQRKGAFDLIQAFADLPPEARSRAELYLAGDGELEQALELIERLDLERQVQLMGWITPSERDRLLARSHVFCLPSYNEGLPIAMLEAMAWKLPVIVTPVGGIADLITHHKHGFLVDPGTVSQLTAAMHTLIVNESLRLSMGEAARNEVVPLNVQNYYGTLRSIYHAALAGKTAALCQTTPQPSNLFD